MRISDWSSDVCSSDLGDGDMAKLDAAAARVQDRRSLAVRIVQRFQIAAQDFIVRNILSRSPDAPSPSLPLPLWLLTNFPPLRRLPARLIGLGVRDRKRTRLNSSH